MRKTICAFVLSVALAFSSTSAQTVWLSELNLSRMSCGWDYYPRPNESVNGTPLTLDGKKYSRGVGTSPVSALLINLDNDGSRFSAVVGVDDSAGSGGEAEFYVLADKRVIWESGEMRRGDSPKHLNVDVGGVDQLGLLVTGKVGRDSWADWCDEESK